MSNPPQIVSKNDQDKHPHPRSAEAARYSLLRRLAPAIRHNMAGALQPLAMSAVLLQRRLQKPDADPKTLEKNATGIVSMSREAAAACQDLMSWFSPKEHQLVSIATGISECTDLLTTEFSMRGYVIDNQVQGITTEVARSAIRSVFPAAMMALTDAASSGGKLLVRAEVSDSGCSIFIELQSAVAYFSPAGGLPYRKIQWDDVEALASEESTQLTHSGDGVSVSFTVVPGNTVRLG